MPVPKKHHTKSKVGRRRSHLALKKINISICTSCKGPVMPHRACAQCGFYENKKKQVRIKAKAEALATQQVEKAAAQQPAEKSAAKTEKPVEKKEKAQPVVSAKKEEEKPAKETPQAEEAKEPQSEEVKEQK